METKIQNRLEELRAAAREAEMRLVVIRNMIVELETLLQPAPVYSGDPLETPA